MRLFKKEMKEVTVWDETTCDICGKPLNHEEVDHYMQREVDISYEHGRIWPDDYNCNRFEPDICSKCFRELIYPVIIGLIRPEATPWKKWWSIKDERFHDIMEETVLNE